MTFLTFPLRMPRGRVFTLQLRIWEVSVQISARRRAIMTVVFPGFRQSLQANAEIVP
jgi:hypothetical protein